MSNIGTWSVDNRVSAWLLVLVLLGGGYWGFVNMGKLEDPAFTIKMAKILTPYPGATAREVQEELTYHLEDALQRLPRLRALPGSPSTGRFQLLLPHRDQLFEIDRCIQTLIFTT